MRVSDFLNFFALDDFDLPVMIWNYVLLIIPFLIYKLMKSVGAKTGYQGLKEKVLGVFLFFIWLIFMPNVAYIVFDIRHLAAILPIDGAHVNNYAWKTIFIFTYSVIGWIAFVIFLQQMRKFISEYIKSGWVKYFPQLTIPVISFGIMLGLIFRLNSWDIALDPVIVLQTSYDIITDNDFLINYLMFTIFIFLLYCLGDKIIDKKYYELL